MRALIITGSLVALFVLGHEARAEYDHLYGGSSSSGRSTSVSGGGGTSEVCDPSSAATRVAPAPRPAPVAQALPPVQAQPQVPVQAQPQPKPAPAEKQGEVKKDGEKSQGDSSGAALYAARCVKCHADPDSKAPSLDQKTPDQLIAAFDGPNPRMPKADPKHNPTAGKLTEAEKTSLKEHLKSL